MVAMDVFAHAFGLDSKSDDVWTTLGKVTAVSGNTLSVLLGGSATPTECEAYCVAGVGDIVFVAITKGQARAIACKGGDFDGNYLPLSGGTITGVLTAQDGIAFEYGSEIWETSSRVVHIRTAANSSNKRADFTFEPDGKIYRRTSTDGGTTWSAWSAIAG